MTDIPEDVRKLARSIALDVFANAVDSDDDSHSLDNAVAFDIIAAAIMADREKRVSNPERMMKDALFALIKAGRETSHHVGVVCGYGKYAWMRFSVEPKAAPEPVDVDAVIEAATPFTEFADNNVDDDGWTGPMKTTRVADWFGPSDFRVLASAIRALKGEAK